MKDVINKNKIYILLLLLVVLIAGMTIGYTYSFYMFQDDIDNNIASTDCFKLEFEDKDEIDIEKGYPLSEEEGSLLKPYQFTIRNVCSAIEEYQINIETLNNSTIETSNIRYKLDNRLSQKLNEQEEVLEYVNENIKESRKIETGELQKNEERTYNLRLWIDEESTKEETANKVYKSKVVIKTVPSVDITINTYGGSVSQNTIRKVVGRPIGQIEEPVRAGYQFLGWYYDSEFTKKVKEEDIVESKTNNIYAKYQANSDTRYTVEHYQMDTNGNYSTTPTTTENLFGTTDTFVTPEVKTYTGFKTPSAEVVNIDGDGSRVVKYYYERQKYTQTTQGRYMNTSGAYGNYSTLETKDVYYGASYSYSKAQTAEYNAASVTAYTVTGTKTNQISFSRRQYTQTTQGRYMNTSGAYGGYSNLETKNVYYGASYSYSKAQTAEYNAASVTSYTVTGAKTNQISFSRRQYLVQLVTSNGTGATSKNVYYNATTSFANVKANSGYNYNSLSCTNSQTASISGTTVTTGAIKNSTVCTVYFTDKTAPTAPTTFYLYNPTFNGGAATYSVKIAGSSDVNAITYQAYINNSWVNCPNGVCSSSLAKNSNYTIYARAKDSAGNVSGNASRTIALTPKRLYIWQLYQFMKYTNRSTARTDITEANINTYANYSSNMATTVCAMYSSSAATTYFNSLSTLQMVYNFYNGILGRPDNGDGGAAWWVNEINRGQARKLIINGFASSVEAQNNIYTPWGIGAGGLSTCP